jgi:hypothetical protein
VRPESANTAERPRARSEVENLKRLHRAKLNLEAPPGFEPGMEVLQTSALPLGDGAARSGVASLTGLPYRRSLTIARNQHRTRAASANQPRGSAVVSRRAAVVRSRFRERE